MAVLAKVDWLIGDNINQKSFIMMKFFRLLICIGTLLIIDGAVIGAEEPWVFINQDQGVTMHSRKVAGRAESEFRGSSTIDQPVEVVGAVLADIPSFIRTAVQASPDRVIFQEWSCPRNRSGPYTFSPEADDIPKQ